MIWNSILQFARHFDHALCYLIFIVTPLRYELSYRSYSTGKETNLTGFMALSHS